MTQADFLRTDFSDREDLIKYLQGVFPVRFETAPQVSVTRGGRKAAEERLAMLNPDSYTATRNSLDGAVTRLSPYLRHGIIGLAEVKERAVELAGQGAAKLVNELGWRDYFQRVYRQIGDGVWQNQEPLKTGWPNEAYQSELPTDLEKARTGLVCMDSFVEELYETGYLHNHARMWLAAYLVHFRRVKWQTGASWFLRHLLDGDPASNNLSWQWVASTFSSKPYFFDRGNLERNTGGRYCRVCPLARRGCPFDYGLEELQTRLFPNKVVPAPEGQEDTRRRQPTKNKERRYR